MRDHNIQPRGAERGSYLKPSWLRRRYWYDGLSLRQMGLLCGCSLNTVRKEMLTHGIDRRKSPYVTPGVPGSDRRGGGGEPNTGDGIDADAQSVAEMLSERKQNRDEFDRRMCDSCGEVRRCRVVSGGGRCTECGGLVDSAYYVGPIDETGVGDDS
jgi:hypothetical protein